MPRHLIPQTFASGAEPDPTTLPPGWLVIIDGVLNAVNDAQDGYDEIGSASFAKAGNPYQNWYQVGTADSIPVNHRFVTYEAFDSADNLIVDREPFPDFDYVELWQFPQFTTYIQRRVWTFKGIMPEEGDFRFAAPALAAGVTGVITIDGVAQTQLDLSIVQDVTYPVGTGEHTIVVDIDANGSTTAAEGFVAEFQPTTAPTQGELYYDEVADQLLTYDGTRMVPSEAGLYALYDLTGTEALPEIRDSRLFGPSQFTPTTAASPKVNRALLSDGAYVVNPDDLGNIIALGGSRVAGYPVSVNGYGYDLIAIGETASAMTAGIGIGGNAGSLATAIGFYSDATDECVAIGEGSTARANRLALPNFPTTGTSVTARDAAGAGALFTVTFYYIRAVDADGFPVTRWTSAGSASSPSASKRVVDVAWNSSDPVLTGATRVQVIKGMGSFPPNSGLMPFLEGAVGTGLITDDWTGTEFLQKSVRDLDLALMDFYGWPRAARAIAIGMSTTASQPNSVVIDNDMGTAAYAGHFLLGNAGNVIDHPGGLTERIRAVTAAHTCDSDGDFDRIVTADATTAAFDVTLPTAPPTGRKLTIKKVDSSANAVTVATPGAETIDGAASHSLATQYDTVTVVYDGTNWLIV